MFASLPMYDRPANRAAHDALWVLIRDGLREQGVAAPDALSRDVDYMQGWKRDDLLLGQICNLPLRAMLWGQVTIIGCADYGLTDCPEGHYNSHFIVHRDSIGDDPADFAKGPFAANALGSHSGYGAPQAWAKARGFYFPSPMITGSHDRSLQLVASKQAAIACIDAQTWRMQQRDMRHADQVRVIGRSAAAPGMTFITKLGTDPAPFHHAISAAIANLPDAARGILGLRGIVTLPQSAYDMPMPPLPQQIDA